MFKSKVLTLGAVGLFSVCSLNAQQVQVEIPAAYVQNNVIGKNGLPNNVVGSPYLVEEFNFGSVLIKGSESYKALMRYNAYRDEIEMKNSDNTIIALMKRDYIQAKFNDELYAIRSYKDGRDRARQGYFIVLAKIGDFELLHRKKMLLREGKEAASSYSNDTPPRFDEDFNYFLQYKDGQAEKVRLKKKDVLAVLPAELQDAAADIVKKNKMKLKSVNEVKDLLSQLNQGS